MSGNSDSDEDDPKLKYLNDYTKLPADAPFGCPHLVDFGSLSEEFPQRKMRIPDLVATVLFRYKLAALRAFLDLERPEVHFVSHQGGVWLDFCIQRRGRVVKVGYLNEREVGGWEELYKYRIDSSATGKWSPISWQGADNDPEEILIDASRFALAVFGREVWDQDDPDVEIEWSAGLLQGRRI